MLDLLISLTAMFVLCGVAALCGGVLQGMANRRIVILLQIFVTILMGGYLYWLMDSPLLVALVPHSGAIVLSNWLPLMGAFFAGICFRTAAISAVRRAFLSTALLSLCVYSLVSPLLGDAPRCAEVDFERILEFQTTEQTCSPACAAGLLRLHGIHATERELSQLCLTRQGTHWLGLYRGLKLKTQGTPWDVVVEKISGDELRDGRHPPGILSLTFGDVVSQARIEEGFQSNVGHSVVSLGKTASGNLQVFDPSPDYGFETWNNETLQDVESAILVRLVSRDGSPVPFSRLNPMMASQWNTVAWARR
ncbi:MAG: hypothetical protein JNM43_15535 [Planctomycetaceae bacterium]|nr:hypothetical protein [Planctomycetaceae bacterium]